MPDENAMINDAIQTTAEEVDTVFDENGISIVDLELQQDPQKIIMLIKSKLHPECEPSRVTMNFDEDEKPSTMDFEGADEFTEEEGKEVLNAVMNSLVTLLGNQGITPDEEDDSHPNETEEA